MPLRVGIELLYRTLESRPFCSGKQQLCDLFASLFVLLAVPIHVALDGLVRPSDWSITVVRVHLRVFPFLFFCLVSPDSFILLRQTVPAMANNTRDVAMIAFDSLWDLLLRPDGGSIDHERIPRAWNTFGSKFRRGL